MPQSDLPTYEQAFAQVLESLTGPISTDEFIARVLEIRPSTAKNPRSLVSSRFIDAEWHSTLVRPNRKTLIPARLVMHGVRFVIPLSSEGIVRGIVDFYPGFNGFLHPYRQNMDDVRFCDAENKDLPCELVTYSVKADDPICGEIERTPSGFTLKAWLVENNAQAGDCIIATVLDWDKRHFRLELETAASRAAHADEIARKNRAMVDALFTLLEAEREEDLHVGKAIPAMYAQLPDAQGYPGDPWSLVVARDPRMSFFSFSIRYADWRAPFEMLDVIDDPEYSLVPENLDLSEEEQQQVYRFKAALKHRKSLWRRIEIQGRQTLADFNRILDRAFSLGGDHMAGFWKRVRRGNSKRFRDVELGDIDPFGEGSGAGTQIAALELQPGDRLKYVFDFGDWIEHVITLEDIGAPEADVKYPRVIEQNKPRYRYCQICKEEGRKTVATWMCIECSNQEGREVLVCEECLEKHHLEHYADEMVY